jgi:uncharacterized protein (TIGR03435 family)
MKPDERSIEEVLQRALPSAPRAQMEAALDRVFNRLQSDRGFPVPQPAAQVDQVRGLTWRWRPAMTMAAAVLVVAAAVWVAMPNRDHGVYAVLETADASLYRVIDVDRVPLPVGGRIRAQETVRSNGGAGAVLALADGSRVEMRSQSELLLEPADDGVRIRLHSGSIIVNASKQRTGHLYVQTKDMTVAVVGTVFVVNAADDGSRVTVIEGEVRVHERNTDTSLRPGEHVSTSPTLATRPLRDDIVWSRNADAHLAILAAFTKGMAATSGPLTPLNKTDGAPRAQPAQSAVPPAGPAFEEASVRLCDPDNLQPVPPGARGGGPNSLQMTPGHLYVQCMTLATLIRTAYGYGPVELEFRQANENGPRRGGNMRFEPVYGLGVEDGRRVRGGPDWIREDRYTIEAVGDAQVTAETMRGPMIRDLLERRFQLKVHVEAEQIPGYALVVAPGGVKMKPFQDGDCAREVSDSVKAERARRGWSGPVLITEAAYFGIKPNCGVYGETNGPNYHFELVNSTPGMVAGLAGGSMGVRVVDRTNITDRFIYSWDFGIDEQTPRALEALQRGKTWNPKPGWDGAMTIPKAPSIFKAVEQLGLKLEPIRVPREFIVIDRVERPSPN